MARRSTRDGVEVTLVPAGHVLGSAQAVLRWKGMTVVVSGDYKRRRDPTCAPFEPVPCDVFVTEATFGLAGVPLSRTTSDEIAKLLKSVAQFPERTHLVGAYALGKAQRVIACCARRAMTRRSMSMARMAEHERAVRALRRGAGPAGAGDGGEAKKSDFAGEIVIAPPSAIADKWSRRFADPLPAFASGWMRVRARARQRQVELPLVISDHADWDELTSTIDELKPGEVWITHGNEEALLRWAR